MFTFCEVVTNVTVGRIGMYDGHIICVCYTNVRDRFETPLKLFVPILCKHSESTIVAVGGIRVKNSSGFRVLDSGWVLCVRIDLAKQMYPQKV